MASVTPFASNTLTANALPSAFSHNPCGLIAMGKSGDAPGPNGTGIPITREGCQAHTCRIEQRAAKLSRLTVRPALKDIRAAKIEDPDFVANLLHRSGRRGQEVFVPHAPRTRSDQGRMRIDASKVTTVTAHGQPQIAMNRMVRETIALEEHEISSVDFLDRSKVNFLIDPVVGRQHDEFLIVFADGTQ